MAIPEFILKKLIVPGSFKTQPKGFTFKILNSFAPAVITRFQIFIGSALVPDELVTFSLAGFPPLSGSDIQPDHPFAFSIGIETQVSVSNFPQTGTIRIRVMTREVGELEFTLSEMAAKNKVNLLRPTLFHFLKRPQIASFIIDLEKPAKKTAPYILGQFVEHLEKCVYGGIWTNDGSQIRQDTLDLICQLNPPIIRYPGGNFASGYHWEDGIGPKEKRPRRHDAAWQSEESNQVGTDEFLAFCESIHSEPYLVVNDGSGSPEEAARWVAYCNNPATTEQGSRRAKNGHPEPYNVKYWGVGNEVWGPWQIGTTSAEDYSGRALRFINAMKAVDPEIKVIAVGNNPLTDDPEDPATLWNQTVLEKLRDKIDYLSWHIYQPEKSGWKESYDPLELFNAVCAASLDIEMIIKRVEKQINQYASGKNILQAVDEWNLWLPPREKGVSMHHVTYTMRDALYVSSVLVTFLKYSHTIGMANLAQLVNVLPLIQTNENRALATSIFYPFILVSQLQNRILDSTIECALFDSKMKDINMLAHTSVPYLDGIATCNESMDKISILLINRYPLDKMKVEIPAEAISGYVPVQAMQIAARTPESFNTFANPYQVRIIDGKLPGMKNKNWSVVLKPCSVYLVEFQKA